MLDINGMEEKQSPNLFKKNQKQQFKRKAQLQQKVRKRYTPPEKNQGKWKEEKAKLKSTFFFKMQEKLEEKETEELLQFGK